MKIGKDTGSLVNHIIASHKALPLVGMGATELLWTDRHAYEVLEVSPDYKKVIIQRYNPKRIDNKPYLSELQEYEYKDLTGPKVGLVFRNGSYKRVYEKRELTEECLARYEAWLKEQQGLPKDPDFEFKPSDYKTKKKTEKINIVFQDRQEYRDPCF